MNIFNKESNILIVYIDEVPREIKSFSCYLAMMKEVDRIKKINKAYISGYIDLLYTRIFSYLYILLCNDKINRDDYDRLIKEFSLKIKLKYCEDYGYSNLVVKPYKEI